MIDLRPVTYVIGLLLVTFGAAMLIPMGFDRFYGNASWLAFAESAFLSILTGSALALSSANADRTRLSLQQTFLMTTTVWAVLPVFAALPFFFAGTVASYTDAFFEAMSGLTTTGSTVMWGLEGRSEGTLLWRGMLQWFGGVGVIVVAMVFLPELRIGGMQIFRSEGFDTFGKILPRAGEIASSIAWLYLSITIACAFAYRLAGMSPFDSAVHAMTTVATGGFANTDSSFAAYSANAQYVAILFMLVAALPFVRFIQLMAGNAKPLLFDSQIRAFLMIALSLILLILALRLSDGAGLTEAVVRSVMFNSVSLLTGTGYASTDYQGWGATAIMLLFFAGLIGGCAGSTACSVKVFRYQIVFAAILASVKRIYAPNGIFPLRYEGRRLEEDVLDSVMAFLVFFTVSVGVFALLLSLCGLDFITALSASATAMANIGPGLGPVIGPAGNFAALNDPAKWILSAAMLIGRLEVMVVFVIFTRRFWQD